MLKIRGKSSIPTDDFILKVTVTKVTENSSKVTEKLIENPDRLIENPDKLIENK